MEPRSERKVTYDQSASDQPEAARALGAARTHRRLRGSADTARHATSRAPRVPFVAVNSGQSGVLSAPLPCSAAGQGFARSGPRSPTDLPSWSCGFDSRHPLALGLSRSRRALTLVARHFFGGATPEPRPAGFAPGPPPRLRWQRACPLSALACCLPLSAVCPCLSLSSLPSASSLLRFLVGWALCVAGGGVGVLLLVARGWTVGVSGVAITIPPWKFVGGRFLSPGPVGGLGRPLCGGCGTRGPWSP